MYNFCVHEFAKSFRKEEEAINYLNENNINLNQYIDKTIENNLIKPNLRDLARIHLISKKTNSVKILEYGSGFSTLIFHKHLCENIENKLKYLQVLEVHNKYLEESINRINKNRNDVKVFQEICQINIDQSRNDGSHLYDAKYKFVPNLIYLDGPDPNDINNNSFEKSQKRVPISSDLLFIESWLEPGTILIVDGRTANVRYLQSKTIRNWDWATDQENDVTVAVLNEEPLGIRNRFELKLRGFID